MVNIIKLGFFVGEYRHNLTEKNRVALPKRFRAEIEGIELILAKGEGHCIEGFDKERWKKMVAPHLSVSFTEVAGREIRRRIFSSAMPVELDGQGRIVLHDSLLLWAGLKGKVGEELLIIGVGDHFEIWQEENWQKNFKQVA